MKKYFKEINKNNYEKADIKESWKFIAKKLKDLKNKKTLFCDLGCAKGEFLGFISETYPDVSGYGYDINKIFIKHAKQNYPTLNFDYIDINNLESINLRFDVISLLGILGFFDNYKIIIESCLNLLKSGGRLIMHNNFNNYDIDVFIKYKLANSKSIKKGWNIFSKKSIANFLVEKKVKNFKFYKFTIQSDIKQNIKDPIRSWTEKEMNGERYIINGLNIKQPQSILIVEK